MAATVNYIESNGVKVPLIIEQDSRLPLFSMQFVFKNSGSIADGNLSGLARLSAKMMGEGTKSLGSSAFAEELESRAIHISATAGTETFVLELSGLKEEFSSAMGYFGALLNDPNLTAKALGNVKSTTLGSLSRKENDYDYVASNQLKAILYEGTVLAQSASGTKESVEAIKLEDVKAFLAEHLVSSRLMIAIGGDLNEALVNEQLQKILDAMPKGSDEPLVSYEVRKEAKEVILKRETEQAYIYFGSPFHIKESDSDYYKSRVAAFILGAGGFGSRLMEEIRVKRGLAYSAYGRINASRSNSHFSGYLQTKIESLEEAQKTVRDVIADFVKNGVSKEELEQTKKFMLGSEPLRVETMSQRLNRTLMEFYKGQEFGHSAKELELIKGLSLKELNEFIASHVEINDLSFAIVTK